LPTGVSGFVAAHIARASLERGLTVRGTVRSPSKGDYLREVFGKEFPGKFDYVIADVERPADLDAAVRDVDGIVHAASPIAALPPGADPQLLIRPAINGTVNILKSAAKAGTVKRVVVTGSIASVLEPHDRPYTYSSRDWNESAVREVEELGNDAPSGNKYFASKVLAERAAYAWVDENKPSFDIIHILPSWIYGPVISQASKLEQIPETPRLLLSIFTTPKAAEEYIAGGPFAFVYVRDVARAHVDALVREAIPGNSRLILASKKEVTFQDFYDAYWALPVAERPQLPFEVPKASEAAGQALSEHTRLHKFDNAEGILGWSFAPLGVVVRETLSDIAERVYNA
ncbi:NAD(P)-binding protein, partial [Auricularia subglabra TFB-10046 SS5]